MVLNSCSRLHWSRMSFRETNGFLILVFGKNEYGDLFCFFGMQEGTNLVKIIQSCVQIGQHACGGFIGDLDGIF